MIELDQIEGFDWDKGNIDKNWRTHKVSNLEAEQVFFNRPLVVSDDEKHSSKSEHRYAALGKTEVGRNLFITFTIRVKLIRVISAREMSKRERKIYNEKTEEDS